MNTANLLFKKLLAVVPRQRAHGTAQRLANEPICAWYHKYDAVCTLYMYMYMYLSSMCFSCLHTGHVRG